MWELAGREKVGTNVVSLVVMHSGQEVKLDRILADMASISCGGKDYSVHHSDGTESQW